MSQKRISGPRHKSREKKSGVVSSGLKVHRFLGLALSGGKTNKTCLVVLEYFPLHKKLFLTRVYDRFEGDNEHSSDQILFETLKEWEKETVYLSYNVALQAPVCFTCKLKCPGYEVCDEPEIEWLWKVYRKRKAKKKKLRLFTPYTERCAEYFISSELEEPFFPSSAMGANMAPLLARAQFLQRRLKFKSIEVFPKLSLWRIGSALKVPKSHLRFHQVAFGGDESRASFLSHLLDANIVFVYEQDRRWLIENNHCFEALLCALTGFLKFVGQCEAKPKDYPKRESWIDFPIRDPVWPG